jgi:hypothetical protein
VGLSGFLYAAIVVGWAVYLVPFALKRHDEAARNRSVERFSTAMRVLGRRDGEVAGSTSPGVPDPAATPEQKRTATEERAGRPAGREAARVAARRRRRVLVILLLATVATAASTALSLLPWWSGAAPGGLVVLWLFLCRTQARREHVASPAYRQRRGHGEPTPVREAHAGPTAGAADGFDPAIRYLDTGEGPEIAHRAGAAMAAADDEPTVVLQRAADEAGPDHTGDGHLWDPVPVTLPTYVHKPRAPRTIRTIDLGAPGTQASAPYSDTDVPATSAEGSGDSAAEDVQAPQAPAALVDDEPAVGGDDAAQASEPTRRAVGQ